MIIDREDMLELTRRMTLDRNCFFRIAGAYMDEEGYADGTYNTSFLKLTPKEKEKLIKIGKAIPFSKPQEELVNYRLPGDFRKPGRIGQLLEALRDCELKNDALLDSLYDYLGERWPAEGPYAVTVFYAAYDVPRRSSDKAEQWESETVYRFLIVALSPLSGEFEAGLPDAGFLYPAFSNHCMDFDGINVFHRSGTADDLPWILDLCED